VLRKEAGNRAGQPEYVYASECAGEWTRVWIEAPAPEGSATVKLQLYLQNAPYSTLWWDEISFEEVPAPPTRLVRVASINLRPRNTHSAQESVGQYVDVIEKSVAAGTDVVLLQEGLRW